MIPKNAKTPTTYSNILRRSLAGFRNPEHACRPTADRSHGDPDLLRWLAFQSVPADSLPLARPLVEPGWTAAPGHRLTTRTADSLLGRADEQDAGGVYPINRAADRDRLGTQRATAHYGPTGTARLNRNRARGVPASPHPVNVAARA